MHERKRKLMKDGTKDVNFVRVESQ